MTGERAGRRWAREPLVHFVLLGALLFAADAALRGRSAEAAAPDEIRVTPGRVESLAAVFAKVWQRPPTLDELRGLVDDWVLEEALVREGRALGLDAEDTVIRRRVRQKMEFVVDDVVELAEPGEGELAAWLAEHGDDYAGPATVRFRHVYLDPSRRGEAVAADARALLAELRAGRVEDPAAAGDATLLGHAVDRLGLDVVGQRFGRAFAAALPDLPTGEWAGPVESAYGLHLVRVDERLDDRVPDLGEVRDAVERDWRFARREEARARFHAELLERYRVVVEWPEPPAGAAESAQLREVPRQ